MNFLPIFKEYRNLNQYKEVDLSQSYLSSIGVDILDNKSLHVFLNRERETKNSKVLYGGYLEKRALYNNKTQFKTGDKQRNIHLGVDFWAPEGTEIVAPIEGVVHSFANNSNYGNYGPTIILRHNVDSRPLFSLYGHLSLESIENKKVGDMISQGEVFASLGDEKVNVGYVPHLHFQLIKDVENQLGDYPGVCHENDLAFYKSNTINPIPYFNL